MCGAAAAAVSPHVNHFTHCSDTNAAAATANSNIHNRCAGAPGVGGGVTWEGGEE